MRDGRWKYRLEENAPASGQPVEILYDIVVDPMEEHDLAELHLERVEQMRRQYEAFAEVLAKREPPPDSLSTSPQTTIDQEEKERLEALGYIEN